MAAVSVFAGEALARYSFGEDHPLGGNRRGACTHALIAASAVFDQDWGKALRGGLPGYSLDTIR